MENFTKDELRTIVWMCQDEGARIMIRAAEKINASISETFKRTISIYNKANAELIKRDTEETK